jgi:hypothetical protein
VFGPPPPVIADARWRPSVTGAVSVVDVRGDPRLSVDESALVTSSADASKLAVADKKAVAIWSHEMPRCSIWCRTASARWG